MSHRRPSTPFALAVAAACSLGFGPCGPIAGDELAGEVVVAAVSDWSFANDVERCAVEVNPPAPHSVTVNCFSWKRELYVSCSNCEGKRWSGFAIARPEARIRVGSRIHPVWIRRVEGASDLDALWRARASKLGTEEAEPRPAGWWSFRLESR